MAKKLLVPENFMKNPNVSSDGKLLLNEALAETEYGDTGYVQVRQFANDNGLKGEVVNDCVLDLNRAGWLKIQQREVHVDPLEASTWGFKWELVAWPIKDVDPRTGQKELGFGDAPVKVDRRALGTEFFLHEEDNTRHDVTVKQIDVEGSDAGAGYELKVFIKDIGSEAEPINPITIFYANADECWAWWDNYKEDHNALERAKSQEPRVELDVYEWLYQERQKEAVEDGKFETLLTPSAFAQMVQHLGLEGIEDSYQFTYSAGDFSCRIVVKSLDEMEATSGWPTLCPDCAYAFIGTEPDCEAAECNQCLLPLTRVAPPVHPEIVASQTEDEQGLSATDADHSWTFEIDEASVSCTAKAAGRGSYDLTFLGGVSEGGVRTERVTKGKYKDDLEGWCSVRASELVKAYAEATSGG